MFLQKTTLLVLGLLIFVIPAEAARNDVNRNSLDKDIVEQFPIPILFGVELADIVPDFGDARGGGTRSHEGQDMHALQGVPIISPTEAIVISTGEGSSAGKYVYTAAPGGETFRYMHLDEIADIKRGDSLDIGDFIGTVGDTGNAAPGAYHLHFEVRDNKNKAVDPYDRLDEAFSLKQKMIFLNRVFREIDEITDEDDYAEFLVDAFPAEFTEALQEKYRLPDEIKDALEDSGADEKIELLAKLQKIIKTIPSILTTDLRMGDDGVAVSLMQTFLIFNSEGPARDRLSSAGATGYFGSITIDAVIEYQNSQNIEETGIYDKATRAKMKA